MAKTIKAIKCPQCGSTQAKKQDEDLYVCGSCGTQYFLDSDDITIHHKHEQPSSPQLWQGKSLLIAILTIVVTLVFVGATQCSRFLGSGSQEAKYSSSEGTARQAPTITWDVVEAIPFIGAKGEALILSLMKPDLGSGAKGAFYAVLDAQSGEELFHSAIEGVESLEITDKIEGRHFANGTLQLIVKGSQWYQFDTKSYALEEVSPERYKQHEALASGIATYDFVYKSQGDGLKLMSNLGKELYYYPIIDKVYTRDELYKSRTEKLPQPSEAIGYAFTGHSPQFQDAEVQLIRYTYQMQLGYPLDLPNFYKQKDFGGSGIFTDKDPHKVVLITDYSARQSRLTGYAPINLGAHYFSPEVLWVGKEGALIAYKPTAAPKERYQYQLLEEASGRPIWTASAPEELKQMRPSHALRTPSGQTLIVFYDSAWLLGPKGETISTLDLEP